MSVDACRTMLERFWIIKDQEKDLFYRTKEGLDTVRKFAREYPGWRLINNERILKLEKTPAHAQPFMGITEFQERSDYALFCALLIFLEDREDGEPFLLSELTDMMEAQLKPVMELDWTLFSMRRSLIRVMQFAVSRGLILLHEGNVEAVSSDIRQEVLYENTGLSRFFAVNFTVDTSQAHSWKDFEQMNIGEADTDRGHFRINRVYRELLACPAMYWENSEDADSLYLKNQRQWVARYLAENLEGRLDIHRNAAFFVLDEENTYGEVFPGAAAVYDIVLLMCEGIREFLEKTPAEEDGTAGWTPGEGETILLEERAFEQILDQTSEKYQAAWSKEYREMAPDKLKSQILDCMENWMMAQREPDNGEIRICPAAFKFSGRYPKDFNPESLKETELEKLPLTETSGKKRTRRKKSRTSPAETMESAQTDGQLSLF